MPVVATTSMASRMVPVEYRGELVALASAHRFHIVAPWLATRDAGDPELRFVAYMCLCYAEIAAGRLPGPFSSDMAERFSRMALIDSGELEKDASASDVELAARCGVPVEQMQMARAELAQWGRGSPRRA